MKSEKELEMRSEIKGLKTAQRPPQDTQRRPKASKLGPTWTQEGSQNRSKIDQNPILRAPKTQDPPETPPRFQNGPQNGFQIVAKSTSKSIQNSFTTDAKCACKLFLRHAGMQVCRFAGMQVCGYAGMKKRRVTSNDKTVESSVTKKGPND